LYKLLELNSMSSGKLLLSVLFPLTLFFYSCSNDNAQDIEIEYQKDKNRINTSFEEKLGLVEDSISKEEILKEIELNKKEIGRKIKTYNKEVKNEKTDSLQ